MSATRDPSGGLGHHSPYRPHHRRPVRSIPPQEAPAHRLRGRDRDRPRGRLFPSTHADHREALTLDSHADHPRERCGRARRRRDRDRRHPDQCGIDASFFGRNSRDHRPGLVRKGSPGERWSARRFSGRRDPRADPGSARATEVDTLPDEVREHVERVHPSHSAFSGGRRRITLRGGRRTVSTRAAPGGCGPPAVPASSRLVLAKLDMSLILGGLIALLAFAAASWAPRNFRPATGHRDATPRPEPEWDRR